MKANELMVGDWIKTSNTLPLCGGEIGRVAAISKCLTMDFEFKRNDLIPFELVNPIPLTPEILEKNGFRKDKETSQWYFKSEDRLDMGILAAGIDDGCGVGFCVMPNSAITYYCKYVHELQHYLRLIGGAEEIIL